MIKFMTVVACAALSSAVASGQARTQQDALDAMTAAADAADSARAAQSAAASRVYADTATYSDALAWFNANQAGMSSADAQAYAAALVNANGNLDYADDRLYGTPSAQQGLDLGLSAFGAGSLAYDAGDYDTAYDDFYDAYNYYRASSDYSAAADGYLDQAEYWLSKCMYLASLYAGTSGG